MLQVALVASVACASHAERVAMAATRGVKEKVGQIDPTVAKTLGDQAARGAVTGALAELANEQQREQVGAIIDTTSAAAVRGIVSALRPDGAQLQLLLDRSVASAGRQLAADATLREQLSAITRQVSASAVFGARDALAEIFPECTGASDRRHCLEDKVGEMSRAAARGMVAAVIDASKWPILVLVFLAGVLVTLLLVGVRAAVVNGSAPAPNHARQA